MLEVVNGVLVIELLDYIPKIEDEFKDKVITRESWGYKSSVDPVLDKGVTYVYSNSEVVELGEWKGEDIYIEKKGELVPVVKKEHVKLLCRLDEKIALIRLLYSVVVNYLDSLNKYTVPLCSPIRTEQCLINKEDADSIEYHQGLGRLYDTIEVFVGNDTWCWYTPRLMGSTLVIKKGIDYRIFDWHKQMFDKDNDRD
jgi:hypothetical protein